MKKDNNLLNLKLFLKRLKLYLTQFIKKEKIKFLHSIFSYVRENIPYFLGFCFLLNNLLSLWRANFISERIHKKPNNTAINRKTPVQIQLISNIVSVPKLKYQLTIKSEYKFIIHLSSRFIITIISQNSIFVNNYFIITLLFNPIFVIKLPHIQREQRLFSHLCDSLQ